MTAPQNFDFSQEGPVVGTAAGWVTNILNTATIIGDYRGSRVAPFASEDFASDWSLNQTWSATIDATTVGLFNVPARPGGAPFEDFSVNWSNFPAMRSPAPAPTSVSISAAPNTPAPTTVTTATAHGFLSGESVTIAGVLGNTAVNGEWVVTVLSPTMFTIPVAGSGAYTTSPSGYASGPESVWAAPATGFCNTYLLGDVVAEQVDYCTSIPTATTSGEDPPARPFEGFDVGWSAATAVANISAANPTNVQLSANHGYAVGQTFSIFLLEVNPAWGLNGYWPRVVADSLASFEVPAPRGTTYTKGSSAGCVVETAFDTNLRPPPWAPDTQYAAGALVVSSNNWYQAAYLSSTTWATSTPYTVGQVVDVPSSSGYYQVVSVSGLAVAPITTTIASAPVSSTIQGANATEVTTATAHGLLSGQYVYVSGAQGNTNINGAWPITVTGPSTFTIPVGSSVPYLGGGAVVGPVGVSASSGEGPSGEGQFTDNPGPAQVTWKYVSATSGTSSAGLDGPSGTTTFIDNDVTWQFVRRAAAGALYATEDGLYAAATVAPASDGVDLAAIPGGVLYPTSVAGFSSEGGNLSFPAHSGAVVSYGGVMDGTFTSCILVSGSGTISAGDEIDSNFEPFSSAGWDTLTYYEGNPSGSGTTPPSTTASYHGWDANPVAPPAMTANAAEIVESFTQVIPAATSIAVVDTVANLLSLAPGASLMDGSRVTFSAVPAYTAFGSAYPQPIVPGVGYVLFNAAPALGLKRMSAYLATFAATHAIQSTAGGFVATVTTATPHGLNVGDYTFIYGDTLDAEVNGLSQVTSVISATEFGINTPGAGGGSSGTIYGPLSPVVLTSAGSTQLTLVQDPTWDWSAPG